MERDLKIICEAMPVPSTGDVSTQASSIFKGITGREAEFDIQTGGSLPTLPAPLGNMTGLSTFRIPNGSNDSNGTIWGIQTNYQINDGEIHVQSGQTTISGLQNGDVIKYWYSAEDFNNTISQYTVNIPSGSDSILLNVSDSISSVNGSVIAFRSNWADSSSYSDFEFFFDGNLIPSQSNHWIGVAVRENNAWEIINDHNTVLKYNGSVASSTWKWRQSNGISLLLYGPSNYPASIGDYYCPNEAGGGRGIGVANKILVHVKVTSQSDGSIIREWDQSFSNSTSTHINVIYPSAQLTMDFDALIYFTIVVS
jgi:hypothetical protein